MHPPVRNHVPLHSKSLLKYSTWVWGPNNLHLISWGKVQTEKSPIYTCKFSGALCNNCTFNFILSFEYLKIWHCIMEDLTFQTLALLRSGIPKLARACFNSGLKSLCISKQLPIKFFFLVDCNFSVQFKSRPKVHNVHVKCKIDVHCVHIKFRILLWILPRSLYKVSWSELWPE